METIKKIIKWFIEEQPRQESFMERMDREREESAAQSKELHELIEKNKNFWENLQKAWDEA